VTERDQIMLVTDGGQMIRCPVHDIRVARRQTQGVTVFKVAGDEQVVAVAVADIGDEGDDTEGTGEAGENPAADVVEANGADQADQGAHVAEPGAAEPETGDGDGENG
jgi:DNA gyrase subunit A